MQNDVLSYKHLKPLIKWAGGKTRLNPQLLKVSEVALQLLKKEKFDYYEPFFGGGALFFELYKNDKINKAYINDIIPHLVSFYKTVSNKNWLSSLLNEIDSLVNLFENGNQKNIWFC